MNSYARRNSGDDDRRRGDRNRMSGVWWNNSRPAQRYAQNNYRGQQRDYRRYQNQVRRDQRRSSLLYRQSIWNYRDRDYNNYGDNWRRPGRRDRNVYYNVYYDDYYYDDRYDRNGRNIVGNILQTVIASFLTNGSRPYYYTSYRTYDYYRPSYSAVYSPSGHYYGVSPVYAAYNAEAYYDDYDPYYSGYQQDQYEQEINIYFGGPSGDTIRRAMETGYYQGLLEGQFARENRWGDRYYENPYVYQETDYIPYAADSGDCRRYLNKGYEMGYNDALADQAEFEPDFAGTDLVSMLIGSTLSVRS